MSKVAIPGMLERAYPAGSIPAEPPASGAGPQPFPPPGSAGPVPACVGSGAGRAGLVHVTPRSRGVSDEVRKREASTSTVLSELIPYIQSKITAL